MNAKTALFNEKLDQAVVRHSCLYAGSRQTTTQNLTLGSWGPPIELCDLYDEHNTLCH